VGLVAAEVDDLARDRDRTLRARWETLTPRERAVFTLVAAGK
jgi:FixJ family two-component response regulator